MHGAYSTCTVMFRSGAAIGMALIQVLRKLILKAQRQERVAFIEAVAGATARIEAGRHTEATAIRKIATATLASALFCLSKQGLICPFF